MENSGPRMAMAIWGFGSPDGDGHLGLGSPLGLGGADYWMINPLIESPLIG